MSATIAVPVEALQALNAALDDENAGNDDVRDAALTVRDAAAALLKAANLGEPIDAKPARVVLGLEGGIVQGGWSSVPVEVTVRDYDTEGADDRDIIVSPDGDYVPGFPEMQVNAAKVEQTEAEIAHAEDPKNDPGDPLGVGPMRQLLAEATAYAREAFENDEDVNGGDLVEWFADWRRRVLKRVKS